MEQFIDQIIQTGPVGIVCASVVYLIIFFQRKSTGEKRDSQNNELEKRISLLENEVEQFKSLDLATKLAQIMTDLQWLKDRFKEK